MPNILLSAPAIVSPDKKNTSAESPLKKPARDKETVSPKGTLAGDVFALGTGSSAAADSDKEDDTEYRDASQDITRPAGQILLEDEDEEENHKSVEQEPAKSKSSPKAKPATKPTISERAPKKKKADALSGDNEIEEGAPRRKRGRR